MTGEFPVPCVHFHNFSKISNQHSHRSNNKHMNFTFITDINLPDLLTPQPRTSKLYNNLYNNTNQPTIPKIRVIFLKINDLLLSPQEKK